MPQFEMSDDGSAEALVTQETVESDQTQMPEAAVTQPAEGAQPEAPAATEPAQPFLAVPADDGSIYRRFDSPDMVIQSIREQDAYIRSLHERLASVTQAPQMQPTPPPDPAAEARALLARELAEVADPEVAQKLADVLVKREQMQQQQQQRQIWESHMSRNERQYAALKARPDFDPDFDPQTNPTAFGIREMFPTETVEQHYQRFLAAKGKPATTTQATAAIANRNAQTNRLYAVPQPTGAAPAAQPDSPYVQAVIARERRARGARVTDADIAEVRKMAQSAEALLKARPANQRITGLQFEMED